MPTSAPVRRTRARRHRPGALGRDRAVLGEQLLGHAEQRLLDLVGVGDDAAEQDVRASRGCRPAARADEAGGARLCDRDLQPALRAGAASTCSASGRSSSAKTAAPSCSRRPATSAVERRAALGLGAYGDLDLEHARADRRARAARIAARGCEGQRDGRLAGAVDAQRVPQQRAGAGAQRGYRRGSRARAPRRPRARVAGPAARAGGLLRTAAAARARCPPAGSRSRRAARAPACGRRRG